MTTAITPTVAIERWKAQRAQEKAKKAATEAKPVIAAVHPASQDQRWKAVKECIAKGDKAAAKAEDFYITAGQHLKALKAEHTGTWAEWEALLKERIGIAKSRASELMQIADGTKTVESVRADSARRVRETEKRKKISPLASGGNAVDSETSAEAMRAPAEQPDQTIEPLAPKGGFSNPITRAWVKATNAQRREFALEYKEVIGALSAEEQRHLRRAVS